MKRSNTLKLGACALALGLAGHSDVSSAKTKACTEDMACWSWSTMGNLDRGVYINGLPKREVVDPCSFAFNDYRGMIDWKRTKHLKGDMFARRHGCDWKYYAPFAH